MPRGHSLDQYLGALFEQKQNFTVYLSGKGNHYYIQTRHNDFFPINYTLFLGKLKEKLARKARLNTARVYWIVLMPPHPPGHPIILLKSESGDSIWPTYR